MKTVITYKTVWVTSSPDASICFVCSEPIYSKKYTLALEIDQMGNITTQTSDMNVCENCFEMFDSTLK